jgi:sarcosine oxidase subunit delta
MLLIPCPYCGDRPELEFTYGGEAQLARPANPEALTDEAWAEYLYHRKNPRGLHAERWRHTHGCGRFFNTWRHTVTDRFHGCWKPGENPPEPPA